MRLKKIIPILIVLVMLTGQVKCVIKAFSCNWSPIGKAEVVYTIGSLTGFGSVIGYFDIEDE